MNNLSITIKRPFITSIDTKEQEILIYRTGIDAVVEYGPDKRQDIQYSDIENIDFKPADETNGYVNIVGIKNATIPFNDLSLNSDMKQLADFLQGKISSSIKNDTVSSDNDTNFKYCYKCGNKIPQNAQYCQKCGADQTKTSEAINTQSSSSSNVWGIWLTIGWICFALALIPKLSIFQLSAFVIGLTVQFKYEHKGAGMALWISSLVIFMLSFIFGFMIGYYYGI